MDQFVWASATALWLGILTSISPCPLATNIVAISFIGKELKKTPQVILSGLFYALGRMVTYVLLSLFLVGGLLSIPELSNFLQKYMNKILGPVLVITGMFLLELLHLNLPAVAISSRIQERAARNGFLGSGFLGILFSLSFCPVSAALFFGSLIPLSVKCSSSLVLPSLYGIGSGLPVVFFAFMAAFGIRSVAAAFSRITKIEWWARRVTGIVCIMTGIYYSLAYILQIV